VGNELSNSEFGAHNLCKKCGGKMTLMELKKRLLQQDLEVYKPDCPEAALVWMDNLMKKFSAFQPVGFYQVIMILRHG
jgi:hypothetical protein